ncbi:MAG: HPr(Ser) kinase/phosphatase [Candidatus Contendobacter odensis]|uniref:HPr(Ser) kinase/phosphatase n=1 Tax=Candidatus Contendibacter odensensis TaxID=1400860 RepID=A0A2G6PG80_9GAMM|nr:MAG: HPr(Ser) kinase/phosphatase [Candidatus Contendobacter odensis]
MISPLCAQDVFQRLQELLDLRWIAGKSGARRPLWWSEDIGELPFGRLNWIHRPRLQLCGSEESSFLKKLEPVARQALIRNLMDTPTGAILVCGDPEQAQQIMRVLAEETNTPLWNTPLTLDVVLEQLYSYRHGIDEGSTVAHGELLEVFGIGVLITGNSGIGKSELALELISRGHRLVADDAPALTRLSPEVLEGTCPKTLSDLLEVRGLGLLNIRRMFGDSAVKRNKRLRLIIHLVRQEDSTPSAKTRLLGMRSFEVILGVSIPIITLPIAPGRNLAVLLECAVRDHIMRLGGYHTEKEMAARMKKAMADFISCES